MRAWLLAFFLLPGAAMAQSVGGTPTNNLGQVPIVGPLATYVTNGGALGQGGTAQTAISAGSMTHGCDLVNDASNLEPLYFAFGSAAVIGSSMSLAPGTAFHCPYGTAQYLSVNAAISGHSYHYLGY